MYELQGQADLLYAMLYAAAAMLSLTACCYLLFRLSNAIAPDVTSPLRLCRWTAAFFACTTMSHVWYLPTFYLNSEEDRLLSPVIGGMLDFMTLIPFAIILLLSMLQDHFVHDVWGNFVTFAALNCEGASQRHTPAGAKTDTKPKNMFYQILIM